MSSKSSNASAQLFISVLMLCAAIILFAVTDTGRPQLQMICSAAYGVLALVGLIFTIRSFRQMLRESRPTKTYKEGTKRVEIKGGMADCEADFDNPNLEVIYYDGDDIIYEGLLGGAPSATQAEIRDLSLRVIDTISEMMGGDFFSGVFGGPVESSDDHTRSPAETSVLNFDDDFGDDGGDDD